MYLGWDEKDLKPGCNNLFVMSTQLEEAWIYSDRDVELQTETGSVFVDVDTLESILKQAKSWLQAKELYQIYNKENKDERNN